MWFLLFYGDYGDKVYKYELTTSRGKPIPKVMLPVDSRFTKIPCGSYNKTHGFLDLDEIKLRSIYDYTKSLPNADKEPKCIILDLMIKTLETYDERPELEKHFTYIHGEFVDCEDGIEPPLI